MQAKILQDVCYNMVSVTNLCCADVFVHQLIKHHNMKP